MTKTKNPTEKQKNAMLKGALIGGGIGTLILPGIGTAGGAAIGYRHQGKKVGVYKSNVGPFGVGYSDVSKISNPFKARSQVKNQLKLVKAAGDPAKSKRWFNEVAGLNGPTKASLGSTRSYDSQRPRLNK